MSSKMDSIRSIKSFTLDSCARGNQGFSRVLIQLFGFAGNGKSSFINTCKCVLDNKPFQNYAVKKVRSDGADTTARISYPLTNTITLVDNRGLTKNREQERAVMFAQLANLLPLDTEVKWDGGYNGLIESIVEAEAAVKSSDFIYPVFVHSVKNDAISKESDAIKHLLMVAKDMTGLFPLVVLTYKKHQNLSAVKTAFEKMRIERIVALENLTLSNSMKTKQHCECVLSFLQEVIEDIQFCLERLRDPVEEKKERKKFVLNYIHEVDMNDIKHKLQEENENEKRRQRQLMMQNTRQLEVQKADEERLPKQNEKMRQKKKKGCSHQ